MKIPRGKQFIQPLVFGEWPLEEVQRAIDSVKEEYDLSKHDLEYVNRGGYIKCDGQHDLLRFLDNPEPCDEIVEEMGKIVWRRVRP